MLLNSNRYAFVGLPEMRVLVVVLIDELANLLNRVEKENVDVVSDVLFLALRPFVLYDEVVEF